MANRATPSRRPPLVPGCGLALVVLVSGCAGDGQPAGPDASVHSHPDPLLSLSASVDVKTKIAQLRAWSASFHNPAKAAEAGYAVNIGCIDERVAGVDASVARGMGYHVTRGDRDLVGDGTVDIDEPEFLVYAPHERDADLPKGERLAAARLVGFDYYVPGALWTEPDPPEFFGVPFNWSPAFQGWVRHIYLWGNNPEGMFEDYNVQTRLCTEILNP